MTNDEDKLVADDELLDLFQPKRVDADAFDAAVRQKIAARREAREQRPSERLQRVAASTMPFAQLSPSSSKGIGWVLTLPILLLAGSVVAFVSGVRTAGSRNPATHRPADRKAGGTITSLLQFGPLLLFAAPWLFGMTATMDVTMALVVVAMVAFTLQVRGSGMAPSHVAQIGVSLMIVVFMACFLWSFSFGPLASESDLGLGASACVLLAGLLLVGCLALAYGPRTSHVTGGFVATCAWIAMLFALLNPLGVTHADREGLTADVTSFHADANGAGWQAVAATVETLDAIGAPRPDLDRLRKAVVDAVEDPEAKTAPYFWNAVARMGLVDDAQWSVLAERELEAHAIDSFLKYDGDLGMQRFTEYRFAMLSSTRELTPAVVDHLAARIEATWPERTKRQAPVAMALCAHLFEQIGRDDLVAAHRDDIHAALERCWVGESGGFATKVGGFTPDPDEVRTSFDEDTWAAIDLMARVGVPDGIDIRMVRAHLRHECRSMLLGLGRDLDRLSRASLVRVEQQIGLPERSGFAWILGERVLVAISLLVLMCALSVVLAARAQIRRSLDQQST